MSKQKDNKKIFIGYCAIFILLISITGISVSVWAKPYNTATDTAKAFLDSTKTAIVTNDVNRILSECKQVDTMAINAAFLQEMRRNGELLSTDEFASRITDYYNTLVAVLTALFVLFTIVTYLTIRSKFEGKFEDKAKELEDKQRQKIIDELRSMLNDSKKLDEVIKSAIGGHIDDSIATKEEVENITTDISTLNENLTVMSTKLADIKKKQNELYLVVSELQEHISASTMVFEVVEEKVDGEKIIDEMLENKTSTDKVAKPEKTGD